MARERCMRAALAFSFSSCTHLEPSVRLKRTTVRCRRTDVAKASEQRKAEKSGWFSCASRARSPQKRKVRHSEPPSLHLSFIFSVCRITSLASALTLQRNNHMTERILALTAGRDILVILQRCVNNPSLVRIHRL